MMTDKQIKVTDVDSYEEFKGKKHFNDFGYELAFCKLDDFITARKSELNYSDLATLIGMHCVHIQTITDNNLILSGDNKKKYEEDKRYIIKALERVISIIPDTNYLYYLSNFDVCYSIEISNMFHKKISNDFNYITNYIKDIPQLIVLKDDATEDNRTNYYAFDNYENWKKLKYLSWYGKFKLIYDDEENGFTDNNIRIHSNKPPIDEFKSSHISAAYYYLEITKLCYY